MSKASELGIAIIGMSGRFPGAPDVEALWRNLEVGVESIRFFSDEELLRAGVGPALLAKPNYVRARGVLDNLDLFDAELFGFTPREAQTANPQQRLFLECAWEALDSAGYSSQKNDLPIGVFASSSTNSYWQQFYPLVEQGGISAFQLSVGNDKDYLPTRISYKLNLKGPSVAVQTACSSSLVAVHLACQALLTGDCDIALAGGASISVPSVAGYLFEEGHINSRDGHCRVFDARASGTVRGDGVAVIVLKRLTEAIADRDHIWAVAMGSAVNNDGSAKAGYTAPGVAGQAAVIRSAQTIGGIDPDTIGYIECHGTGTILGDPIEIAALSKAFRAAGTSRRQYCAVGSIKSNIGHLDATAGVAGLIKAALAIHHGVIPKTLHFATPNPRIDFEGSPFYVAHSTKLWKSNGAPRRAGVSSYGIGGTNAHIVLEGVRRSESSGSSPRYHLLPLSARTLAALDRQTESCRDYLKSGARAGLADVAFSLQNGRREFACRRTMLCKDGQTAAEILEPGTNAGERSVVFLFPGQGAQSLHMGRRLYETERVFREQLDICAERSRQEMGVDLREVLYPATSNDELSRRRLDETNLLQPALFAVEYAVARLWMNWGVRPAAMIGHSIGEYVAACLAGVLSLDDAIRLVVARGRAMHDMPPGAMVAVPLSEHDTVLLLSRDIAVAAINGPNETVVSGTMPAISEFERVLCARGIEGHRLHTTRAFHSQMLDPVLDRLRAALATVRLSPPKLPYVSNLTGAWMDGEAAVDPEYWVQHARQPVRFWDCVVTAGTGAGRMFLEAGPGRSLAQSIRRHWPNPEAQVFTSLPHPSEPQSEEEHFLATAGRLWTNGIDLDWRALGEERGGRRVPLFPYPFERQSHKLEYTPEPFLARASLNESETHGNMYVPSWRRSANPRPATDGLRAQLKTALVFKDDLGVAPEVVERLRSMGGDVIEVAAGERFANGGNVVAIHPMKAGDYLELVRALVDTGKLPTHVVHLWNVAQAPSSMPADFSVEQHRGFFSLMYLTQALARLHVSQPMRLTLVSNNAQCVHGTEHMQVAAATTFGAASVISQEYPNLICRSVDVSIELPRREYLNAAADQIVNELGLDSTEPVAYRGSRRWMQAFEPMHFSVPRKILRPGMVWLITGGLGKLGTAIAGHLARKYGARVTLTTTTKFPGRPEWKTLSESASDPEVKKRAAALLAIEAAGGQVMVQQADSANEAEIRTAIERTEALFGPLNGVIHGAGVTGARIHCEVRNVNEAEAMIQWRPKILGMLALDAALGDRQPEFCVSMSSLASVLGGLGFGLYASGNAFLDAFAQARWKKGFRDWVSVNWDGWRFDEPHQKNGLNSGLLKALLPSETGLEVFETILTACSEPQVIVSATDLHERLARATAASDRTDPTSIVPTSKVVGVFGSEIELALASVWRELLGAVDLTSDDNFFVKGGDSLVATRLVSRIRELFEVDLPIRTAFEAPTIATMATSLLQYENSPGRSEKIACALNSIRS